GPRSARRPHRRLVSVAIGFVELYPAVAVGVRSAAKAGDEIMSEKRAAQLVRLLRVLVEGTRCEKDDALSFELLAETNQEWRGSLAALDPRERARTTGVDEKNAKLRRRAADEQLQLREIEPRRAEVERRPVGMPRVVHEEHALRAR